MDLSKRAEPQNRVVRSWRISDVEVRSREDGTATFRGIASVTGQPYEVHDMFGPFQETIEPSAFNRTLSRKPDVAFLLNHEGATMARTTSGTLRLSNPNGDLEVEADLDVRRPDVQNVVYGLERGDLDQMSFAFRVPAGGQSWNDDYTERSITEVDINRGDVSVVNYGANPYTSAALRSLGCNVDEFEGAFEALRTGVADDGQRALVERVAHHLGEALKPRHDPDAALRRARMQLVLNRNYAA